MKVVFLIVFFSLSTTAQAGDRLKGISGSMGDSPSMFSGLFSDDDKPKKEEEKVKRDKITDEDRREAEQNAAEVKNGKPRASFKDISDNVKSKKQDKKTSESLKSDAKAPADTDKVQEFEDPALAQLASMKDKPRASKKSCVTEKVYTLDVPNAEQYESLEDFPFTYECVSDRE